QGLLPAIVLGGQPQDAVMIQSTPDRGEGVAIAEVHATQAAFEAGRRAREYAARQIGIDQSLQRLEATAVFLTEATLAHGAPFLFEEGGLDAGNFRGRHLDALPVVAALDPGLVEEPALAARRGQADHPAARDREHGADGTVKVIGDASGLVEDEEADAGE